MTEHAKFSVRSEKLKSFYLSHLTTPGQAQCEVGLAWHSGAVKLHILLDADPKT